MYKYAQIDCCGFVVWLRTFPEQVDEEDMIPVGEDFDPAGKHWNGTGWEEYEPKPVLPPPLSEQEQIAIDTALNVEYIACLMEANL